MSVINWNIRSSLSPHPTVRIASPGVRSLHFLAETIAGAQYVTLSSGVITDGSVTLPASAVIPGPDGNTPENTITNITNPKSGIYEVTNQKRFEGGRNTETDAEFRERYYISVDFAGGVNIDAIVAEVYESVEAVIAVSGEANNGGLFLFLHILAKASMNWGH